MILSPLVTILGAAAIGVTLGLLFNFIPYLIKRESEGVLIVVVFGMLLICFGFASLLGFDELLSTMVMGGSLL